MNQWPGVRLRVTEGWDEEGHHTSDSLHYEGRAVDVTTSDRDRSKYGMLARLAVEAGFDWVYYESRAHIHCSVKSESSDPAKYGGCFSGDSIIQTSTGKSKKLSELQIGEKVLSVDTATNQLVFSEVLMFLDWDPHHYERFLKLELASGRTLTVTPSHLLLTGPLNQSEPVYASALNVGNSLIVHSNSKGKISKDIIVKVTSIFRTGIFAPLTAIGTIIVNDILTSCYAVFDSHLIAHWTFAPIRIMFSARNSILKLFNILEQPFAGWLVSRVLKPTVPNRGVHWYPKIFYHIGKFLMPWRMRLK